MKITLRELFVVVLLVGVALGWLVDRRRLVASQAGLQRKYDAAGTLAGRLGLLLRNDGGYVVDWSERGISVYRADSGPGANGEGLLYSNVPDNTGATGDIWRLMGEPPSQLPR